jgi:hypothetical protein
LAGTTIYRYNYSAIKGNIPVRFNSKSRATFTAVTYEERAVSYETSSATGTRCK